MPVKIDDQSRFYLEKTPFETEAEHWQYVRELAEELHSELVDLGAGYGTGPELALAKAVHDFVQQERSAKTSS